MTCETWHMTCDTCHMTCDNRLLASFRQVWLKWQNAPQFNFWLSNMGSPFLALNEGTTSYELAYCTSLAGVGACAFHWNQFFGWQPYWPHSVVDWESFDKVVPINSAVLDSFYLYPLMSKPFFFNKINNFMLWVYFSSTVYHCFFDRVASFKNSL